MTPTVVPECTAAAPGALEPGARLAGVLDRIPDVVIVTDPEGRLLWGNRAAEQAFGRTAEESVGLAVLELVHPDDLDLVLLSLQTVQHKDAGAPIEVRAMTSTGWRLFEVLGAPMDGTPPAIVFSLRDLTERRRFEIARDEVATFRAMVHHAASLTMLISPDGRVVAASGAVTRALGYDPEQVEGRPLAALVGEEDRTPLAEALEVAPPSGAPRSVPAIVVARFRHGRTNDLVPFELEIVDLRDDPTIAGYVLSGHDVSSRRAAEHDREQATSVLSAALESTWDGILVVDLDGRVTASNARFREMWRFDAEVLPGTDAASLPLPWNELRDPDGAVARAYALRNDPEAESHDTLEFADGRVFERYSRPQRIGDVVVGRVWSFRDVTARAELEAELTRLAFHDPLTKLANRVLFETRVEYAIRRARRTGRHAAVLFIDLDDFKGVNDAFGHSLGDALLAVVGERIAGCVRGSGTAARLGGDEFAAVLDDVAGERDAMAVAERVLEAFAGPIVVAEHRMLVRASIGVALSGAADTAEGLITQADRAMYGAKRKGKGRCEVVRPCSETGRGERTGGARVIAPGAAPA